MTDPVVTANPLAVLFATLADYPDDVRARVAVLFEMGTLCARGPYNDYKQALDFFQQGYALGAFLDGIPTAFANNIACVMHCSGHHDVSERALKAAGDLPEAVRNAQQIAAARMTGRDSLACELSFASVDHPVVTSSRRTSGPELRDDGVPVTEQDLVLPSQSVFASQPVVSPVQSASTKEVAPPHVLLVMYGWEDSGGGTILPFDVAHGFAERGHQVTVLYAGAKPREDLPEYGVERKLIDGIDLIGIFNRPSGFMDVHAPDREIDDPRVRSVFESVLELTNPDVVHFFNLHNLGMSLAASCKRRGIPTLLSSNNYWAVCPRLYLFDNQLELCSGPSDDGAKCASCLGDRCAPEGYKQRQSAAAVLLHQDIDVHLAVSQRSRQIYLSNGADADGFPVLQQQPASLDRIWAAVGSKRQIVEELDRPLVVGLIGSLFPHKGAHLLAAALQAFPKGSVRGLFHGELTLDYARTLTEIDKLDVVELTGAYDLEQLPSLLASVDVVVVPSIWEDCAPFVVAEALASRAPVIGSRMGGIPDFVEDGKTGFLFDCGNANDLAQKILPFLKDRRLLGQMQAAIQAPRGFHAYLDDLEVQYQQLVSCNPEGEGLLAQPLTAPV